MKCDRCNKYHQRTFVCHNEFKIVKGKGLRSGEERLCGECIMEIWGVGRIERMIRQKLQGEYFFRKGGEE